MASIRSLSQNTPFQVVGIGWGGRGRTTEHSLRAVGEIDEAVDDVGEDRALCSGP